VTFVRGEQEGLQKSAWALHLKISSLAEWDKLFDRAMTPLTMPEKRGQTGKVTVESVSRIVFLSREMQDKGQRLRLKSFTQKLNREEGLDLGRKTVEEILIANDLYQANTRRRRPGFYQRLKQSIPNGLLSVDGSEFTVKVNEIKYTFNVELAVDVQSYYHSGFSIAESETAREVVRVIEAHKQARGTPLAIVSDHGSGNLSGEVSKNMRGNRILPLPAGPGNPKGNGTVESAFSGMKKTIGPIVLTTTSPADLAKSVLEKVISVYISMRNRLPLWGQRQSPEDTMGSPVADTDRQKMEEYYKNRALKKQASPDNQQKTERIDWIIHYHHLQMDEPVLKRARTCLVHYDMEAIAKSEEAFLSAIRRDPNRRTLPYFFGILKRVQKDRDEQQYKDYCFKRYNENQMKERDRQKQHELEQSNQPTSIASLVAMLQEALQAKAVFIRQTSIRVIKQMLENLKNQYRYMGILKKKIADALGEVSSLSIAQRQEAFNMVEQFLT
jgi:transposase InsO family protein